MFDFNEMSGTVAVDVPTGFTERARRPAKYAAHFRPMERARVYARAKRHEGEIRLTNVETLRLRAVALDRLARFSLESARAYIAHILSESFVDQYGMTRQMTQRPETVHAAAVATICQQLGDISVNRRGRNRYAAANVLTVDELEALVGNIVEGL